MTLLLLGKFGSNHSTTISTNLVLVGNFYVLAHSATRSSVSRQEADRSRSSTSITVLASIRDTKVSVTRILQSSPGSSGE